MTDGFREVLFDWHYGINSKLVIGTRIAKLWGLWETGGLQVFSPSWTFETWAMKQFKTPMPQSSDLSNGKLFHLLRDNPFEIQHNFSKLLPISSNRIDSKATSFGKRRRWTRLWLPKSGDGTLRKRCGLSFIGPRTLLAYVQSFWDGLSSLNFLTRSYQLDVGFWIC